MNISFSLLFIGQPATHLRHLVYYHTVTNIEKTVRAVHCCDSWFANLNEIHAYISENVSIQPPESIFHYVVAKIVIVLFRFHR